MSKRDAQRRQADRDFEEIRQVIAAQSDEWLSDALREIPHRKWIEIEKDSHVAVGILAHRAAERIEQMNAEWKAICDAAESMPAGTVEFQLRRHITDLEKALRKIAALDYKNAATNGAAYEAVQIASRSLMERS